MINPDNSISEEVIHKSNIVNPLIDIKNLENIKN